ncbi:MAG TPA: nucleotide exchange factor GrpE [Rubrobacteraceae bacterium]|nr:nucleotide exchange factor GrpE [Rubrobacteraceae bacterium]
MSSEERKRREGEPREEFREEPPGADRPDLEAEEVSEPVEVGGSEAQGVVPPEEAMEDAAVVEEADEGVEDAGEPPSEEPLEITGDEISALADELELARRERDEYLDDMRRMKAELENSRKRQEKERVRLAQLASERLVRELLPVLDNLERALEAEGDIREGVAATLDQFISVLGREGLTPVLSDGEPFDPTVHEAVMGQPSEEHEEDTVIQTFERGYTLNGRPLRPAKVVVAKQV